MCRHEMNITNLPDLILHNIFSRLATSSTHLCTISLVCKQWRQCSLNPLLWRALLFKMPRGKLGENMYGKGSTGGDRGERRENIDWRKIYMKKCMGTNWHTNVCPVFLNGHNGIYHKSLLLLLSLLPLLSLLHSTENS